MSRFFIEVAYKGTRYSGFQVQENAITIQSEIESAFQILHRRPVELTGSSRTDAGVHALQNFFHFDWEGDVHPQAVYKLNAILPDDIAVKAIHPVGETAHSRFDATSREYIYRLHRFKNPFLNGASLFYPYKLNQDLLDRGTECLLTQQNFYAFSKTNTQVKNFNCQVLKCQWTQIEEEWCLTIEANRFLRGMVRLLTATLLKLGRGQITLPDFKDLFQKNRKCGFSVPAHGLYLKSVHYPENLFPH